MEYWRKKKEKKKEKEKENGMAKECFLRNGSIFLEKVINDCNGISNPIRMFSSDQISKATNRFDLDEDMDTNFIWYKGDIGGRHYAIKRYRKRLNMYAKEDETDYIIKMYTRQLLYVEEDHTASYNDIVLSARVSNHSGFLKLIGYCLECPYPVSVFEDLDYRVLNVRGSVGCEDAPLLPWNLRLKIAKDVATAITYLHTAFPRIIIHRNIKAENVFLDKNGKAKLSDFSHAITLPEGKSWIETKWSGSCGYIDSGYVSTIVVTEYTDVFSFGVLMLVLLIGRPAGLLRSDGQWDIPTNISEYVKDLQERGETVEFGGDSNDMNPVQMKLFLELALRCCDRGSVDQPKMIVVAKVIKLIEKVPFDSQMLENVSEYVQIKH